MKKTILANACLAVAALLAAPAATASNGRTIYKCVDAKGVTTFQAAPCASGAQQSEVKLREPPPDAQSPGEEEAPQIDPETGLPVEKPVVVSYECTTAQGWTFYKHRPCPPGVRLAPTGAASPDSADRLAATQGEWVRVSGAQVTRLEACRRIAEGNARKGHVFDDVVTERDRAAGRDPCLQK